MLGDRWKRLGRSRGIMGGPDDNVDNEVYKYKLDGELGSVL